MNTCGEVNWVIWLFDLLCWRALLPRGGTKYLCQEMDGIQDTNMLLSIFLLINGTEDAPSIVIQAVRRKYKVSICFTSISNPFDVRSGRNKLEPGTAARQQRLLKELNALIVVLLFMKNYQTGWNAAISSIYHSSTVRYASITTASLITSSSIVLHNRRHVGYLKMNGNISLPTGRDVTIKR